MKTLIILIVGFWLAGCASGPQVKRTQENDYQMRVMVDPSVPTEHYVQIESALVQSGKFEVIDRRAGFEAALKEQDLEYMPQTGGRFADREKWSRRAAMYGVDSIITANASCYQAKNFWGTFTRYCKQTLMMIEGHTGKVMFAVTNLADEPWVVEYTVPAWTEAVQKAVETYPEYFKPRKIDPLLEQYMDQSGEESQRARESQAAPPKPQAAANPQPKPVVSTVPQDIAKLQAIAREEQTLNEEGK